MQARQYERVDELRQIMAGLEYEDSATTVSTEVEEESAQERAAVASLAVADLVDALQDLTLSETNDETRREYSSLWTDAIILLGDIRRVI